MGKSKRRHKKGRYTPISRHQRRGSQLVSAMGTMNMEALDWERDLLPEYLWIASLEAILIEKKILTKEEIDRRLAEFEKKWGEP